MFGGFRITSRHAASVVAVAASLYFSVSQLQNDKQRQERDLALSSAILADALRELAEPAAAAGSAPRLQALAERYGKRGRLAGIAFYDAQGRPIVATASLAPRLRGEPKAVKRCLESRAAADDYETVDGRRMRVDALPLKADAGRAQAVAVFHGTSFIDARAARTRWDSARRMAIQAALFLAAVWVFGLFFK